MADMPQAGTISDVLRKVDEDIAAGKPLQDKQVALPDPSPSPMDVHREKLEALIGTASAVALDNGRQAIERQHALMRAVQAKRDQVAEVIEDYLRLIQSVTDCGNIIHDSLVELERQFSPQVIDPKANGKKNG